MYDTPIEKSSQWYEELVRRKGKEKKIQRDEEVVHYASAAWIWRW